jgi:hypothetical protein
VAEARPTKTRRRWPMVRNAPRRSRPRARLAWAHRAAITRTPPRASAFLRQGELSVVTTSGSSGTSRPAHAIRLDPCRPCRSLRVQPSCPHSAAPVCPSTTRPPARIEQTSALTSSTWRARAVLGKLMTCASCQAPAAPPVPAALAAPDRAALAATALRGSQPKPARAARTRAAPVARAVRVARKPRRWCRRARPCIRGGCCRGPS